MTEGDTKNYLPLQVTLITKKRENLCRILVDAAPKFVLYSCRGCPRCKVIEEFFAQRRRSEDARLEKLRKQFGSKSEGGKKKEETVRPKSIETQVNHMVKESVLHALETTHGKWTFETRAIKAPSNDRHHFLTLNSVEGVFDLTRLWNLFPDEKDEESSDESESEQSEPPTESESDAKKKFDEDVRAMRRRVLRLLKANCDLRKQKLPLLHQRRSMTRYCESWIEAHADDHISHGAPESGADLKYHKMGSGKTLGALQDLACRPQYDRVTVVGGNTTIDYWRKEIQCTGHFLTTIEKPSRLRRYAEHVVKKRWAKNFQDFTQLRRHNNQESIDEPIRAKLSKEERRQIRSMIFSPKSLFHPDSGDKIAFSTVYDVVGYQEFTRKSYGKFDDVDEEVVDRQKKRKTASSSSSSSRKNQKTSNGKRSSDEDEETTEKYELSCVYKPDEPSEPSVYDRRAAIVDEPQKFRNGTKAMKVGLSALQKLYGLRILTTGTLMVNDTTDILGVSCLFGAPVPEDGTSEEEAQKKMPVKQFARLIAGRVNYYDMQVHNPVLYEKCFPTREEVLVKVPLTWKQTFTYIMSESQKVKFMGYTINTSKSNSYGMRTLMVCNKPEDCKPEDAPKMRAVRENVLSFGRWPQVVYCNLVENGAETVHEMLKNAEKPKVDVAKVDSSNDLADMIRDEQDEDTKNYIAAAMVNDENQEGFVVAKSSKVDGEAHDGRIRAALLTGKTPASKRQKIVDDFSTGRYDTLTLTDVGSIAIDLKGGAQALHLTTPPPNEATADQILARIARYMSHAHCNSKHVVLFRYLACFPKIKDFYAEEFKDQIKELQDAVYEALTRKKASQASREQIEREAPLDQIHEAIVEYLNDDKATTVEEDIYARGLEKTKRIAPYVSCVAKTDVYDDVNDFVERVVIE